MEDGDLGNNGRDMLKTMTRHSGFRRWTGHFHLQNDVKRCWRVYEDILFVKTNI